MGRHTEQRNHDGISMDKCNPNRRWIKLLNVLDYHRWNYVKKMLPHKKHGAGRDGHEAGDEEHACNGDVCTINSSQPEEKATEESVRKGRAARIRAKIAKEVMKKRLRHRRSSTCSATAGLTENDSSLDVEPVNEPGSADPSDMDDLDSSDEEQPFPLKLKNIEHDLGRSEELLDVLSMNKDLFLKVLVDPEASLAQHFMVQHASGKTKYLDKSRTFPRPCPSKPSLEENNRRSFGILPKGEVAGKHFKDLRQRIKHVSKVETHRIALDSVLDKVPYGLEQLNLEMDDRKKRHHTVNRWPSLNESMERYCRLIEAILTKHTSSADSLKLRMSSSPDLLRCLRSPLRKSTSFNELNSQLMLSCFEKSGTEDEAEAEATPLFRDGPTMRFELPDSDSIEEPGCSKTPILSKGLSSVAEPQDNLPKSSHYVRVQTKDQEHFDYVKDVLQLSGYLETEVLGAWQPKNQPVDSSLFAELEGCSLQEPDCSESEQGTRCNRLLLFDSVNEVLLSTYERSMAYWSSPLTSCSQIHPMPKGYRVLEMVWTHISWYLNSAANQLESSLDRVVMHDLAEDDGWMNLQFDAEGTALDLENLIFEDILMEVLP